MKVSNHEKSAALLKRSQKVLAGGVSSEFRRYNYPHALYYTHGKGSRIYDVDGNEYLDFTLSQGPLILGHSHPVLLQSIEEYSRKGQLFAGQHIREIELAEKINNLIPSAELMRFSLSGSEAIQAAFRIARTKTGKNKFLRFEGHYHGWLDNVAWGLSIPENKDLGSRKSPHVFPWSEGLPRKSRDEFEILPWNDLELVKEFLEQKHHEIAAIITEPIMCNKGCILPEKGFLQGLRELCTRYDIALIFDEVITGFRIDLGGAQTYFNVTPDLSIFAKALASGYPLSVVAGKKDWMKVVEDGRALHAGTMNSGNAPVAAALATLSILEQEKPHARMFALGQKLMEGIRKSARKYDHNLLVTGPGPMFCVGFTNKKTIRDFRDTLSYDNLKLKRLIVRLHQEGVRVIGRGLWYISTAHTEEDIEHTISVVGSILSDFE